MKNKDVVVFTEEERKFVSLTLEAAFLCRDVGLASETEVKELPVLKSAIKKLAKLIKIAKVKGIVKYNGKT